MNCEILRTLYLKANGEIVCNDDMGEQVSLGLPQYEQSSIGIVHILQNKNFRHIREAFASNTVPWPGICENCALLRAHEPVGVDLLAQKTIDKLQVESSLACGLRCPSCSNGMQLRQRPGPVHLPDNWFRKFLKELAEEGYKINWIEFCGQGEPLNHPDFADLVASVREFMPGTRVRVISNGNHSFMRKIGSVFVDETIVSIDGAQQESYARYRVNGRFDRALKFLQDSVDTQVPRGGNVIWKYILFTSNDSDEELRAAQDLAEDIGVSRLWFVHGHGAMASRRFTFHNATAVPVTKPFVKVESHPSYNNMSRSMNAVGEVEFLDGPPTVLWLDRIVAHDNDTLTLVGWVNSGVALLESLNVALPNAPNCPVTLGINRPDVLAAFPEYTQERCGFDVLMQAPGLAKSVDVELVFEVHFVGLGTAHLRRRLDFSTMAA